jgi:hypothetical protein
VPRRRRDAGADARAASSASSAAALDDQRQQKQQQQHDATEAAPADHPVPSSDGHHHHHASEASTAAAAEAAPTTTPPPQQQRQPTHAETTTTIGPPWRSVALVTGLTLFLANAHRSAFAALLPPLLEKLSLTPSAAGALQAAMLTGYLAAQVPAGAWADRWGGPRVLLWSCAGWSLATALTALAVGWAAAEAGGATAGASAFPAPMAALMAARFLFGAASAGVMPCVAAMAVRWVPRRERAASTSLVYAAFNLGGVAALAFAPLLAAAAGGGIGAAGALLALGFAGAAWAAAGGAWLRSLWEGLSEEQRPAVRSKQQQGAGKDNGRPLLPRPADADSAREVFTLCFAHGVIGCGFFLLSGLMPLILASIGGGADAQAASSTLAAVPWLIAAATGVLSGRAADAAIARGAAPLSVRRAFQVASFVLCALSVLPLAIPHAAERAATVLSACPRALAASALAANLVSYSLSFGGFHAYLQDVAGSEAAGTLQGLTNSVSICCGAAATLFCGWVGEAHGGYAAAFAGLCGLYVLAAGVWAWGARGARVRLRVGGAAA